MQEGERAVVLCFGEAGRGKTHTLRQLIHHTPRVLVADVTGNFRGDVERSFTSAAECAAAVDSCTVPDGAGGVRYLPFRYRLALDLDGAAHQAYATGATGSLAQLGPRAAAIGYAAKCCAVVLDELSLWCSPKYLPPNLELLAGTSRHRGVSFLATARRPAEVHRLITSVSDLTIAFQTVEPLDLVYLKERFGSAVSRLPHLPPRRALAVGDVGCLRILGAGGLPRNVELLDRAAMSGVRV